MKIVQRSGVTDAKLVPAVLPAMLLAVGTMACTSESAESTVSVVSVTQPTVAAAPTVPAQVISEPTSTGAVRETTTTTSVADEVPLPDTSGDDWFTVMSALTDFGGWLFENPRTDLVEYYAEPGSEAYENVFTVISEYVEKGWRDLPEGRPEPREVVAQSVESNRVRLLYISDFDGSTVVDASGDVVMENPDTKPTARIVTLVLGDDGRWRVRQVELIGELEGAAE